MKLQVLSAILKAPAAKAAVPAAAKPAPTQATAPAGDTLKLSASKPVEAAKPVTSATTNETTVWSATRGPNLVSWTAQDITSSAEGVVEFSMAAHLKGRIDPSQFEKGTDIQATAKVKSLVGGILSVEWSENYAAPGAASPGGQTRLEAIRLDSGDERAVTLDELFPAADIHRALLNDGLVKAALKAQGISEPAKTLDGLLSQLDLASGTSAAGRSYMFSKDLLSRFSFHQVQGNQVAVRLGLPSGTGADRHAMVQLGLLLPIPEAMAPSFDEAKQEGALGANFLKLKGQEMHVDFSR